ncbi:EamA family transporter [Leptospira sarikeiensis]|uniref:Transporter n=1 Tax=Leptospira sarikeiensis TaxID=2484943 RepID=A0A4R9KCK1_9LEPT|nr:EamA family transporter [Leptospira sarikeiensis]TGL63549.1 transporter [Leptospira sarikeiensis]
MKNISLLYPILFALLAAVGNALFAYGQKKSASSENPFLFLIFLLIVCLVLLLVSSLFVGKENSMEYFSKNIVEILVGGIGLYLTFLGFYFLFTRYGTTYYILYAVFSILTTSIFLGAVVFKESFNFYHILSVGFALGSIFMFHFAQSFGK